MWCCFRVRAVLADSILYSVVQQQGNPGSTHEGGPNLRSGRNDVMQPAERLKWLSCEIYEADASGHSLGEPGVEGTDLRMDVSQKCESRPSPNLHN